MLSALDPRPAASPQAGTAANAAAGLPPVILLGGGANALSVARSLSRAGAAVYAINEPGAFVRYSRHCRWLDVPRSGDVEEAWARYLLGPESDHLRGAILLSCSDAGIRLIARHRGDLEARFRLDDSNPDAQLAMLDKLSTYQAAQAAGVPTPRFWIAEDRAGVEALRDQLVFPLLVKPRLSHLFEERFGAKFLVADDFTRLLEAFDAVSDTGIETLLMELIPGGDDRLCSYYTYLDDDGRPLFHFTKRVIRRNPVGMGTACYHVTDWIPEVADLALRLCTHAGLRGLANVEFKRDPRDGQLKLMECNARFTASNCLVARSGFDLAAFVYNRLAGRPQPPLESYALGMRLWDPVRDFEAFLELRRRGELTLAGWLRSIAHRQSFIYFEWSDPLPALARATKPLRKLLARRGARA
jgi:predicted ATP-grasp superfamily ATP-dependent carboligase